MRLSSHEMELFESACANSENTHAQDLLNVFGAERALEVLQKMPMVPLGIVIDVVRHLWLALTFEAYRIGGDGFVWTFEGDDRA